MIKKVALVLIIAFNYCNISAQSNKKLALTPPMGWNSWNMFEGDITEEIVKGIADAFVSSGLKNAGYEYILIDDVWQGGRDNQNRMIPDPKKFPSGIKALADYVHSKGLKFGIYSDAAHYTCGGYTASYGFEKEDAKTFAEWGVDYLKYDYCHAPKEKAEAIKRYSAMSKALKKSGRDIVFAICEWGQREPWTWASAAGGNLWRTTWDSRDIWETKIYNGGHAGIMNILDKQVDLEKYARPGSWNDPDMLMVGLYGKGKSSSHGGGNGCTDTEYKSHFSLWCMLAAPLIVNLDVRDINESTKNILLNKEMIAIDQDKLGKQASRIIDCDDINVFLKQLSNNEWAICFLNRSKKTKSIDFNWNTFELNGKKIKVESKLKINKTYNLRDIWKHKTIGNTETNLKAKIESHDVLVLRLIK
ncbi:MAG: glycoside hydrolase family 27 protein [Bacteroidetes bacterium]|nr:MAG: glycoside hydrolase family 27 protein [Bacteroidota bacterium]